MLFLGRKCCNVHPSALLPWYSAKQEVRLQKLQRVPCVRCTHAQCTVHVVRPEAFCVVLGVYPGQVSSSPLQRHPPSLHPGAPGSRLLPQQQRPSAPVCWPCAPAPPRCDLMSKSAGVCRARHYHRGVLDIIGRILCALAVWGTHAKLASSRNTVPTHPWMHAQACKAGTAFAIQPYRPGCKCSCGRHISNHSVWLNLCLCLFDIWPSVWFV